MYINILMHNMLFVTIRLFERVDLNVRIVENVSLDMIVFSFSSKRFEVDLPINDLSLDTVVVP